jgi:hypothetical protein
MKRAPLFTMLMCCLMFPYSLLGQVLDSTVCNILANPQAFNGKLVRIKGVVVAGLDEFAIKGQSCNQSVDAIWLAYPNGTNAKAGPAALLRLQLAKNSPVAVSNVSHAPIVLNKNGDFENFDELLSTPATTHGVCLGCAKYSVTAVLVGRLDAAKGAGLIRDSKGSVIGLSGFGNLDRYSARLVLQSVSEVSSEKIDYARGGTATSGGAPTTNQPFKPGVPTADQVKRAVEAFGAEGEDNGVIVSFGPANEVPQNDTAKSNGNSPDGIIFDVTFDGKRLKGPAMQIALAHIGTHIADIRSKDTGIQDLSLYGAEFRAWQTSVLMAAGRKVKSLMLPDGYTIYSKSWPNSELGMNANAGISGYLATWAGIENLSGQ